MTFNPNLNYGDELNNIQLREIFKCGPQGGMRKSNTTNTLILISDHTQPYYEDRWKGEIFYYTGMGLEDDQDINYMQNKTLANSDKNGVDVFLFEVNKQRVYTFIGKVKLASKPFTERQIDKNKHLRKVWIFPLKLDNKITTIEEFIRKQEIEEEKISRLPIKEIEEKAKNANKIPIRKDVLSKAYERNPNVAEYAKLKANGRFQLCNSKASFNTKENKPFLEIHHIIWLSEGGEDSII